MTTRTGPGAGAPPRAAPRCGASWSQRRCGCSRSAATRTRPSTTSRPRPASGGGRSSATSAARRTRSRPTTRRRWRGSRRCSSAAHPTEPTASLVLRAGRDGLRPVRRRPGAVGRAVPAHPRGAGPARPRVGAASTTTGACSPGTCGSGSPDEPDGELRAAVIGAAVVAAHNLALRAWLAGGAPRRRAGRLPASGSGGWPTCCRSTSRAPPGPKPLSAVARRLEEAVGRLERTTA